LLLNHAVALLICVAFPPIPAEHIIISLFLLAFFSSSFSSLLFEAFDFASSCARERRKVVLQTPYKYLLLLLFHLGTAIKTSIAILAISKNSLRHVAR
jgi:hypothetical protein